MSYAHLRFLEQVAFSEEPLKTIDTVQAHGTKEWFYYTIKELLKDVATNKDKIENLLSSYQQLPEHENLEELETRLKLSKFDFESKEHNSVWEWLRRELG
eukprot:TRINITY_DN11048_c0_g1_i1.p1 TRINITY_DN11048_c0_g1~~TRINITY_DN11048_c0_g1_i1.p1  ORF type:complete len:114 (+),score=27.90 TRINITY_DN11048_c0_g1_i1:44-343(+)